eukprot:CAMPEP_0119380432 /NCGR_PEP_ID=MMETSP1334-20130426/56976_1 /TAXON_ID=127549 /ORGANISM="Calcidiscus leptoporus, Strain RCC1130" /LENGTH=79 /DNA_ID=CAMNT_0007400259 /DNA_START=164 /DNA_END=403 /DNA_ORIENTATION=+
MGKGQRLARSGAMQRRLREWRRATRVAKHRGREVGGARERSVHMRPTKPFCPDCSLASALALRHRRKERHAAAPDDIAL